MRKGSMKKRLENSFPYPRLTASANRRFDEILSCLPDRIQQEEGLETAVKGRHYAEKAEKKPRRAPAGSAEPAYFEEAPRRSWLGIAAKCAGALAVLCVVGLFLLNLTVPAVTEGLPVLGGFFQAMNGGGNQELPVPSFPEQTKRLESSLSVENASIRGDFLFLDLRLDSQDPDIQNAAWLSSELNSLRDPWENVSVTLEGQDFQLSLYNELVFESQGEYLTARAAAILPDELRVRTSFGGDLFGSITVQSLWGMGKDADSWQPVEKPELELSNPLSADFYAGIDEEWEKAMSPETGGIQIENVERNEDGFTIFYSYPARIFQAGLFPSIELRTPSGDFLAYGAPSPLDNGTMTELTQRETQAEPWEKATETVSFSWSEVGDLDPSAGQVICHFFNSLTETGGGGSYDGVFGNVELAAFVIDLNSVAGPPVVWSMEDEEAVFAFSEYASRLEAGLPYYGHTWVSTMGDWSGWGSPHGDDTLTASPMAVTAVYTDLDQELPLQMEFYVNGDLIDAVPLYRWEKYEKLDENGFRCETSDYCLEISAPQSFGFGNPFSRRAYYVSFYFTLWAEQEDFWEQNQVDIVLRNTVSKRVLYEGVAQGQSLSGGYGGDVSSQAAESEPEPENAPEPMPETSPLPEPSVESQGESEEEPLPEAAAPSAQPQTGPGPEASNVES